MDNLDYVFGPLGMCFCIFVLARLVHNCALYLEDKDQHPRLEAVISYTSIFLYILALPVSIAIGLIEMYPNRRIYKIIEKEAKEEEHQYMERYMQAEIRRAVKQERERLRKFYETGSCPPPTPRPPIDEDSMDPEASWLFDPDLE